MENKNVHTHTWKNIKRKKDTWLFYTKAWMSFRLVAVFFFFLLLYFAINIKTYTAKLFMDWTIQKLGWIHEQKEKNHIETIVFLIKIWKKKQTNNWKTESKQKNSIKLNCRTITTEIGMSNEIWTSICSLFYI